MSAVVTPVGATDSEVVALVDALTAELAGAGYTDDETFGYSVERLAAFYRRHLG